MCGIVGIVVGQANLSHLPCIKEVTEVIRHRGLDDERFVFFQLGEGEVLLHGGEDSPDSVYRASLNRVTK